MNEGQKEKKIKEEKFEKTKNIEVINEIKHKKTRWIFEYGNKLMKGNKLKNIESKHKKDPKQMEGRKKIKKENKMKKKTDGKNKLKEGN